MKKKAEKEKMQIPQEEIKQLSDKSIPVIDRVAIGEEYRKKHGGAIKEISSNIPISDGMYCKYRKILGSGKGQLIDGVKTGCLSLRQAYELIDADENSTYFQSFFRYAFISSLETQGIEILAERHENILYRSTDGVFLAVICGDREEKCQVNDEKIIIQLLQNLIENGDIIRFMSGDFVVSSDKTLLKHRIVATITGEPIDEIKKAGVSYKREPYRGIHDLRVSNLTCTLLKRIHHPEACGGFVVDRVKDTIKITDETRNETYVVDYSPWLYSFLAEMKDKLRLQARDNRLSVSVNRKTEYIYHIVMAVHLFGFPENQADLEVKLNQFKQEYTKKGKVVDHVNADTHDNRISNLIIMTDEQNRKKEALQKAIKQMGLPVFCWVERCDDTDIKMEAGYASSLSYPDYKVRGIFLIPEFLKEMEEFVVMAQNDSFICREFRELERALNKIP